MINVEVEDTYDQEQCDMILIMLETFQSEICDLVSPSQFWG